MKTLHLTNAWHASSGGIATFYRALIRAGNDRQDHVRLVVPAEKTSVEEAGSHGRIYHLQAPKAPFNSNYRVLYTHRYMWPGTAIHSILASERPELVEICDKYTLNCLAGLLRMKWIPGLDVRPTMVALSCERMDDNVAAYVTRSRLGKLFSRLYMKRYYFPLFDHHITISEYTAEELRLAAQGHRTERGVWVRPMGVDLEGFCPDHASAEYRRYLRLELGGTEDSVLLLYAGRLVPEKNLSLLIGTLAELSRDTTRDYRLLVVGDGILAEKTRRQCERVAPGRATFWGHVGSRRSLAKLYASADVFIHPNPREPFGMAPLEAMASGVPLVAPNSGGLTTYAQSHNSWATDATPEAFAAAVRSVVNDPEQRLQRTREAQRTAATYDWNTVAHRFLRLYEAIHALNQGREVDRSLEPQFFSTRSGRLGIEL